MARAGQLARRTVRAERREFLAEGPQAVREALATEGVVREIFATGTTLARHGWVSAAAEAAAVPLRVCDEDALASLAGSVSPQGVVACCRFVDVPLPEAIADARLVAVGAHLRDPGNAGSLIRCADAAGAGAVVLAGTSVDPYNDKAVRSSAGSIFHLPIAVARSLDTAIAELQRSGFTVLAAAGDGDVMLDDLLAAGKLARRVAWVFGNEAWGIPPSERALCDLSAAVPIYGRAESLNVATAAAVCLYATAWAQRRRGLSWS